MIIASSSVQTSFNNTFIFANAASSVIEVEQKKIELYGNIRKKKKQISNRLKGTTSNVICTLPVRISQETTINSENSHADIILSLVEEVPRICSYQIVGQVSNIKPGMLITSDSPEYIDDLEDVYVEMVPVENFNIKIRVKNILQGSPSDEDVGTV